MLKNFFSSSLTLQAKKAIVFVLGKHSQASLFFVCL
jgi:hypothetical protein